MRKIFLFASVAMLALSSCKKDPDTKKPAEKVFKGEAKTFQHGKAWTWYEVADNGNPLRLSIAIDDAAMASLERSQGDNPNHHHENSVSLKVHPKAQATPFTHVLLDWNPDGHPPGFYELAHFDFHFYTQTEADRLAIPFYEQAEDKFDNVPTERYMPANYIPIPEGVPQMGKHWVDITSSEFTDAGFNQTFLYGTYDGKVTFYEPMITEQFILNNPTFSRSIPTPEKFQKAGWYPTKMRIAKQDGATHIILEDFVQRAAN